MAAHCPGARAEREAGAVVALDVQNRQASPGLRDGKAQRRERRRHPRLRRAGRGLGRRHVHERSAHRGVPGRCGAVAVAAVLLHRSAAPTRCCRRRGRPVGVRVRHAGGDELLRRAPRVGNGGHGSLHQGAQGHRHRPATPTAPELKAADKGYPLPPTNGSWQTDLRSATRSASTGRQWVLEYWSDTNNVFQFVRVEDIAYDKRPGMEQRGLRRRLRARPDGAPRASTRPTSSPPTAACGRWCSTRRTRRR